jgi:hypothetical protein
MELAKELKRAKPYDDKLKDHKLRFASKFFDVLQGKNIHKYMKLVQGCNLNENKNLKQNLYVYFIRDT